MPGHQLLSGRGAYDRRPRRVRDASAGDWLARPARANEAPEWTKDRTRAWLGLAGVALQQIDVLRDAHGIEAEMD